MSTLAQTRTSLHAVAEMVLAGPEHRATNDIRLRITPGGFSTWQGPPLRVDLDTLVSDQTSGAGPIAIDGATCARLAALAGVDAGAPKDLYTDGSGRTVDDVLRVVRADAVVIAEAFAVGDEALRAFVGEVGAPAADGSYTDPVLWPEHFDVGITHDEINYGVSPGDGYFDVPYAYVGPLQVPDGAFWNAPFGAARPLHQLGDAAAVTRFFVEGRERVIAS